MKQISLIIIIGIISLGDIYAQGIKQISYQLDFGPTVTIPYKKTVEIMPEFDGHPTTNYTSDFGYFVEFLVSYNLTRKYSIQTGLNYNYTSLKISDNAGLIENKGNLTNSYFSLPILFKYRLSEKIPFSISTGPYIAYLVKANEKGTTYTDTTGFISADHDQVIDPTIQQIDPVSKYYTDIKKDYTAVDYGLSLQLDYEINRNKLLNGVIITRFNYGLKNVLTNNLQNNSSANDWKNYHIMFGFGFKL